MQSNQGPSVSWTSSIIPHSAWPPHKYLRASWIPDQIIYAPQRSECKYLAPAPHISAITTPESWWSTHTHSQLHGIFLKDNEIYIRVYTNVPNCQIVQCTLKSERWAPSKSTNNLACCNIYSVSNLIISNASKCKPLCREWRQTLKVVYRSTQSRFITLASFALSVTTKKNITESELYVLYLCVVSLPKTKTMSTLVSHNQTLYATPTRSWDSFRESAKCIIACKTFHLLFPSAAQTKTSPCACWTTHIWNATTYTKKKRVQQRTAVTKALDISHYRLGEYEAKHLSAEVSINARARRDKELCEYMWGIYMLCVNRVHVMRGKVRCGVANA